MIFHKLHILKNSQQSINNSNPTSMYVGTLTADEIVYAGGKISTSNQNPYLLNMNIYGFLNHNPHIFLQLFVQCK